MPNELQLPRNLSRHDIIMLFADNIIQEKIGQRLDFNNEADFERWKKAANESIAEATEIFKAEEDKKKEINSLDDVRRAAKEVE